MKTLLYTITNFSPNADDCINLMYDSLKLDNNTDFLVVSNTQPPENFKHNTVVDSSIPRACYVGFLKYSEMIPKGYNQYIYLDSDILYFGEVKSLYNEKEFTIVRDHGSMQSRWFYYENHDKKDLDMMIKTQAINGGTFAFKNIEFIKKIKDLYTPYISKFNTVDNAILEQSSYNYAVAKTSNFTFDNCYDITDITVLYAAKKIPEKDKYLYHFCGFRDSMIVKYQEMKELYDEYKRRNS